MRRVRSPEAPKITRRQDSPVGSGGRARDWDGCASTIVATVVRCCGPGIISRKRSGARRLLIGYIGLSKGKEGVMDHNPAKVCPKCGSPDTRLSHRTKGVVAALLTVLNMSRYRCRSCRHQFVGRN